MVSGAGTNTITVDFGPAAANGKVSVIGTDTCGAGASSSINRVPPGMSRLPLSTQ
ncbi:MAG: hypothetical protein ACHQUC_09235 [Chlamydiales bacterium]